MTRRITLTTDPAVARWVEAMIGPRGTGLSQTPHISLAVQDEDGVPLAGIVYHNWDKLARTCEISAAGRSGVLWMTRPVINAVFDHAFSTLQMVWARHPVGSRIHRQWRRFGGEEAIVRRMFGPDTDGAIHTFTREEWLAHPLRYKDRQAEAA